MATYDELQSLFNHDNLRSRTKVAVIIAAETIKNESPATANHINREKWAKHAWENPSYWSERLLMAVLAANKTATVAQITGVTDANLQVAVDAAVNIFADGT